VQIQENGGRQRDYSLPRDRRRGDSPTSSTISCRSFGPLRESPAERGDEGVVALAGLGARGLRGGLRQRRRGGEPEADEHGQRLDGDADIALQPRHAAVDLVEALGDRRFLPLGGVRRQEGRDGGLGDQRRD
jgi:hypothetical protein